MNDTLRDADLSQLVHLLQDQRARALDVVAPATALNVVGGVLVIADTEPVLTDDGVDITDGAYYLTDIANEGLSEKLGIHIKYLRRMWESRLDLYEANINGWLHGSGEYAPPDQRSFLIRCLRSDRTDDGDENGIVRAFLSDRFKVIDNLDVILAALDGMKNAGVDTSSLQISGDLTTRRLYLRVTSTAVEAQARELLARYRAPNGDLGRDNPIVNGGFLIRNSEVGQGMYSIVPRILVRVCSNGMTIEKDAMQEVHLGSRLDQGVVEWSAATQAKSLDLIRSQTVDAVRTFLNPQYVQDKIDGINGMVARRVTDGPQIVRTVSQRLGFSQEQERSILDLFVTGADATAGGVMQAVTAQARREPDGDAANELERKALDALRLAFVTG